jgi:putative heme-binding domain-containing protein
LGDASIEELVEALANPNIWWRRNAQRLLLDRNSTTAVSLLKTMANNTSSPLGRLHALWTLEGLGKLSIEMIEDALKDTEPGIRENAIRLAELHLDKNALGDTLLFLQDDENPKVRYQLLLTLGFDDSPSVVEARQKMLFRDIQDGWVQVAALSATTIQENNLLEAVLERFQGDIPQYTWLVQRLSTMIGRNGQPKEIQQLIQKASKIGSKENYQWQTPVLKGLTNGIKSQMVSDSHFKMGEEALISAFFQHPSEPVRSASLELLEEIGISNNPKITTALQRAIKIANNTRLLADRRAEAISFIALSNPLRYSQTLKELIIPAEPPAVQLAALQALSSIPGSTVSEYVLENWQTLSPKVRKGALQTFLVDMNRTKLLLDAIETGVLNKASIGQSVILRLTTQGDQATKDRALSLLTEEDKGQRKKIVQEYTASLELKGDVMQGKEVYEQACAVCHTIGGTMGMAWGPDLATIRNREPSSILNDILNPASSIADGYDLWIVTLKNDESNQGIVSTETPTAITLRSVGGQEKTFRRQDIKSLQPLGVTAMPNGLENAIDHQDMANLLAFLRHSDTNSEN